MLPVIAVTAECFISQATVQISDISRVSASPHNNHTAKTPPDLPIGFFAWIRPLLTMPEVDVLRYAGFDAIVFLRFYKMAFKVSDVTCERQHGLDIRACFRICNPRMTVPHLH